MKTFFEYTDFQDVEDRIEALNNEVSPFTDIPTFIKKTWALNEFPYINEVDRIERAIGDLQTYFINPSCFITPKVWLETPTSIVYKNYSWSDYQRWLNNLNCIETYKEQIEYRFAGESYSGDSIWL
jgi:hypothetical protein